MMHEITCNRCHFTVSVTAPPPRVGTTPSWEMGPIDVNTRTGCMSLPITTCPYLQNTIMAAYEAGKLL